MFNELTKLFGAKKERRYSTRKRVRFSLSWIKGPADFVPGTVTEISLSGLLMITKAPPPEQFDAVVDIGTRKIRLRLTTARSGIVQRGGENWHYRGCSFSGIAADDYDALVRAFNGIAEPTNKAAAELAAQDKTDDAYRLLPMKTQQRVLEALVRAGRLEMPPPNTQPLLRMSDLGRESGRQRVAVHSRIPGGAGGPQSFDSVLAIEGSGIVRIES